MGDLFTYSQLIFKEHIIIMIGDILKELEIDNKKIFTNLDQMRVYLGKETNTSIELKIIFPVDKGIVGITEIISNCNRIHLEDKIVFQEWQIENSNKSELLKKLENKLNKIFV